jgi:DNA-binding HxlR family transcriptional regulator
MRDIYAEYVAWETKIGDDMLSLARKEGRAPMLPTLGAKPAPRVGGKTATPETITIMRTLAEREAYTHELAEVANITSESASSRLEALRRTGVVKVAGTALNRTKMARKTHLWALGPKGEAWLERYGVTHG